VKVIEHGFGPHCVALFDVTRGKFLVWLQPTPSGRPHTVLCEVRDVDRRVWPW